jgi:outer membrane protein assembly factor BamD
MSELNRFKKVYPQHANLDYANYLLALCYYEQIVDEKKDLESILKAKKHFTFLINNYPNTEYAIDAEFKIDLINDTLASKEMYIGRYYLQKKKWIPAINRFRKVIDDYDRTIYVQEALHRLVEVHYILGLKDEAKKFANLLGYNYKSSQWYEMSYTVFNRSYEKEKVKKNKKSFLNKAKSIFD